MWLPTLISWPADKIPKRRFILRIIKKRHKLNSDISTYFKFIIRLHIYSRIYVLYRYGLSLHLLDGFNWIYFSRPPYWNVNDRVCKWEWLLHKLTIGTSGTPSNFGFRCTFLTEFKNFQCFSNANIVTFTDLPRNAIATQIGDTNSGWHQEFPEEGDLNQRRQDYASLITSLFKCRNHHVIFRKNNCNNWLEAVYF